MKNNTMRIALVLCLCVIVFAAWDKDKPSSSTSLRNSNPEILANWSALETALAQDHEFSTGGTNSGKHEVLTMEEEASAGASSTNELHVQAIDGGSGQPEFAITSEDGNELQMTKDGDLYSSAGLTVTDNATFNGGATLGADDDLIGSSTSDINMGSGNFTVAGATGNTVVGGTLDVTGNIDPTTYETTNGGFQNDDAFGSVTEDTVASTESIKAYIDAQIAAAKSAVEWTHDGSTTINLTTLTGTYQDVNTGIGGRGIVFLKVKSTQASLVVFIKTKGESDTQSDAGAEALGCSSGKMPNGRFFYAWCETDTNGYVQAIKVSGTDSNITITVMGYLLTP